MHAPTHLTPDNKVKIWNTLPILNEDAAANDANHKLLCTMSAHTGKLSCHGLSLHQVRF